MSPRMDTLPSSLCQCSVTLTGKATPDTHGDSAVFQAVPVHKLLLQSLGSTGISLAPGTLTCPPRSPREACRSRPYPGEGCRGCSYLSGGGLLGGTEPCAVPRICTRTAEALGPRGLRLATAPAQEGGWRRRGPPAEGSARRPAGVSARLPFVTLPSRSLPCLAPGAPPGAALPGEAVASSRHFETALSGSYL